MMVDPPMHHDNDGLQYISYETNENKKISTPQCWKCKEQSITKEDDNEVTGVADNELKDHKKCGFCNRISTHKISIGKISEFHSFQIPGSRVIGDVKNPIYAPKKGETLCGLSGYYMIYQYTKGHRFTTDDVCTAYFAVCETRGQIFDEKLTFGEILEDNSEYDSNIGKDSVENINSKDHINSNDVPELESVSASSIDIDSSNNSLGPYHLDLGTGLGSVLLMMKWKFGDNIKRSIGIEAQMANLSLARRC